MTKRRPHLLNLLCATAVCCWPLMTVAQTPNQKDALIITSFALAGDPVSRDVRSDALAVSEALLGLGYNVRRLENPDETAVTDAVASEPAVIYYAGTEAELLPEITASLADQPDAASLVFLDACRAELVLDDTLTPAWTLPEDLSADLFIAASVAPDAPCGVALSPMSDRLLEGLQVPGLAIGAAFENEEDAVAVWTNASQSGETILRQPSSDMRLTADDYALLDSLSPEAQAQMIALWTQAGIAVDRDQGELQTAPQAIVRDTIVISDPVQPIAISSPIIAPVVTSNVAPIQDGITVISPGATPNVENRAVPGVGGLPTPSVIVGLIATEAAFGTVTEDGGALSGSELDYTNLDARRAMRDENPTLFASLIEGGAFDPPPSELVIALQTELTRMECYNRGIDGSWGGGSAAGLERYYQQIDETPENLNATLASFRQILVRDDIVCPPVVVAQPRAAPQATSTPRRTTAAAPAPRRATPAPAAPAPAPAAPTRTINRSVGTGVFR